jgi:hypothetical protein
MWALYIKTDENMNTPAIIFQNCGKLAEILGRYTPEKPIILGMPHGGVIVKKR